MAPELRILIVDNEPDRHVELRDRAETDDSFTIETVEPQLLTEAHLRNADLISVDHYLGDTWDETLDSVSKPVPVATRAKNGIAVAAALDSRAPDSESDYAITLHTADLDELGQDLPKEFREPLVAAQHGLDWVFRFNEVTTNEFSDKLLMFGADWVNAREALAGGVADFGADLLQLPRDLRWSGYAHQQLANSRPPVQSEARYTHGRAYFRWISQKLLPFPSLLVGDDYASNLLGIEPVSFDALVSLTKHAGLHVYDGPLAGLFPRRWWVASIQQLLSDAGVDEMETAADRSSALHDQLGVELTALASDYPTVVVDREGRVTGIDAEREETVRLSIDGWPTFAEEARVTMADVQKDTNLRDFLPPSERRRLDRAERAG